MYRLNENIELTAERVSAYINDYEQSKLARLKKLERYYLGKHAILSRELDAGKPNNKVIHTYANYISNTMSAYFMGNSVKYKCDDDRTLEELEDIFNYNDEDSENFNIAKDASIYGTGYELVYVDTRGYLRFKRFEPIGCIPIYDDTMEEELLYFIRYYDYNDILNTTGTKRYVEVYTRQSIRKYEGTGTAGLQFMEEQLHGFNGYVPVTIYKNNEEELGDFEQVISLIDAYDSVASDSVNDMDQFADSYLVMKGFGSIDDEDIDKMRTNRIILLDDESDAKFLVKDVNDTYSQNVSNRLNDDIYKFSGCIDLTSDISALSGVAIKYRLLAMENICSIKEMLFKKGLLRRIELISVIENILNPDTVIKEVEMVFTRNLPTDATESVDLVNKLEGIVSDETLLSLLPFVDDPNAELEKRNEKMDIYEGVSHEEDLQEEY